MSMKRSLIVAGAFVAIAWAATAWARRKRVRRTHTDALLDLFSMKGRLSRKGFCLNLLCATALLEPAQASRAAASSGAVALIALTAGLCALWIFIAALVRRFRDVNLSSLWGLLSWAVTIGLTFAGETIRSPLLSAVGPFLFGGTTVVIGMADGTVGSGRFGPDPLEAIVCQPEELEPSPSAARCRLLHPQSSPPVSATGQVSRGHA